MPDGSRIFTKKSPLVGKALPTRAYSTIVLKAIDNETRTFTGIASTPTTDRMGDIVDPMGATFTLPIPLLWQHNSSEPIGWVEEATPTKNGIKIKGRVAQDPMLPQLDEVWAYMRTGLVRGLSIGFDPQEYSYMEDSGGFHFMKWDWLELSVVTIPANEEANILSIKSYDSGALAALRGHQRKSGVVFLTSAGASASSSNKPIQPKAGDATMAKTVKEQIAGFEAKRAADHARMNDIMSKASEEERTLTDEEKKEYDELSAEVGKIDEHLVLLRAHEANMAKSALPVDATPVTTTQVVPANTQVPATTAATPSGGGSIQIGKSMNPKGTDFTRFVIAMALHKGNKFEAAEYAKQRWKDTPYIADVLKAAVAAGTTTDGTWAGPLAQLQQMASEFIELLRPQTVLGRLTGLRNVPFNVQMPRTTSGTSVGWVGQGAAKPITKMGFESITLPFNKIAGIVVLTEELMRFSNPNAEATVRTDLTEAVAQFMDQQFLNPAVAASGTTSPASITNGAHSVAFTGTSIAQITADGVAAITYLSNNNIPLTGAYWIMHPRTALFIGTQRTTQDVFAFPGLGVDGGTWLGLPVLTTGNMTVDTGADTFIVLVQPREVLVADEGGVTIDVSNQASVQMSDAPAAGAQSLVSFWQNNLVGIKAERYITWRRRRDPAVYVIKDVTY